MRSPAPRCVFIHPPPRRCVFSLGVGTGSATRNGIQRGKESSLQRKADFEGNLPMLYLAVLNAASRFKDLEPGEIVNRLAGAFEGEIHRLLDTVGGSTGEFNGFIDMFIHKIGLGCFLNRSGVFYFMENLPDFQ